MKKGIAGLLGSLKWEDKETIISTANNIQSFLAFIKDNVLLFVDFFGIEAIAVYLRQMMGQAVQMESVSML